MKLIITTLLTLLFFSSQLLANDELVLWYMPEGSRSITVEDSDSRYTIGPGHYLKVIAENSWAYTVEVYGQNGTLLAVGQTAIPIMTGEAERVDAVHVITNIGEEAGRAIFVCPPPDVAHGRGQITPVQGNDGTGPLNSGADIENLKRRLGAIIAGDDYNRRCGDLFFNTEGEIGEAGREIISAVQEHASQCLYNQLDVSSVCPNYRSFTPEQKDLFWAFGFAGVAQHESSCNPDEDAQGVNDVADGLFQMEFSWAQRRSAGRDRELCVAYRPGTDSQNIRFQAQCSISILRDIHCEQYQLPLNSRHGYWHLLRGEGAIVDKWKQFPGCR